MCTRYPIINRVSELKVHIELTRFVQPEKIEIDANERAVNEKSQYCFFVCTTFDSFLNDLLSLLYHNDTIMKNEKEFTHNDKSEETMHFLHQVDKDDNDQCKQNRLGAGTAFGLPLHSFHFQKIKKFVFLKVTSCIYY